MSALQARPTAATLMYAIWQSVDRSEKCSFMQAASLPPPGFASPQTDLTSLAQAFASADGAANAPEEVSNSAAPSAAPIVNAFIRGPLSGERLRARFMMPPCSFGRQLPAFYAVLNELRLNDRERFRPGDERLPAHTPAFRQAYDAGSISPGR